VEPSVARRGQPPVPAWKSRQQGAAVTTGAVTSDAGDTEKSGATAPALATTARAADGDVEARPKRIPGTPLDVQVRLPVVTTPATSVTSPLADPNNMLDDKGGMASPITPMGCRAANSSTSSDSLAKDLNADPEYLMDCIAKDPTETVYQFRERIRADPDAPQDLTDKLPSESLTEYRKRTCELAEEEPSGKRRCISSTGVSTSDYQPRDVAYVQDEAPGHGGVDAIAIDASGTCDDGVDWNGPVETHACPAVATEDDRFSAANQGPSASSPRGSGDLTFFPDGGGKVVLRDPSSLPPTVLDTPDTQDVLAEADTVGVPAALPNAEQSEVADADWTAMQDTTGGCDDTFVVPPTQQFAGEMADALADTLVDVPSRGPGADDCPRMPQPTVNVRVDADSVVIVEDTGGLELSGGESGSDNGSVPPTQVVAGAATSPPVNAIDVSAAMQAVVDGLGNAMARASDALTALPDLDARAPPPADATLATTQCTGGCTHILRQRQGDRVIFLECGDPCAYDRGHPIHSADDEGHACTRCRGRQRVPYV